MKYGYRHFRRPEHPQSGDQPEQTYRYGTQGTLSHHSIYSILFDRMQTIWIGTYAGGISYYNPYGHLRLYSPSSSLNKTLGILGPAIEHDGTLYIGAEGED